MIENKITSITDLLQITNSKLQAYNEFKNAYDNQVAFDFNLFNFFNVGENKVSEILAYFLDEKQGHGQGKLFLEIFIADYLNEDIDTHNVTVKCEYLISNRRRIDILIELSNKVIAIENKHWAIDQKNQLNDYSVYLDRFSNGNYKLFYLNPYGDSPSTKSIDKKLLNKLTDENKFQIISYKNDILDLISKWISACEADNVTYFLKQYRLFLKKKFLGNKTLNMSNNLKELIFQKREEVEILIETYREIENKLTTTLNNIGKELKSDIYKLDNSELKLKKEGPFNYYGKRVFKFGITSKDRILWVQLIRENIDLKINYYINEKDEIEFKSFIDQSDLQNEIILKRDVTKQEIISIFIDQIRKGEQIVLDYLNQLGQLRTSVMSK